MRIATRGYGLPHARTDRPRPSRARVDERPARPRRYHGKRALRSVTLGAPAATYACNGRNGDVELLLWPMAYSLYYVGHEVLEPFVAYEISGAISYGDADPGGLRDACERELRARLCGLADELPLPFNGIDDLAADGRLRPGIAGRSAFIRDDPSRIPNR